MSISFISRHGHIALLQVVLLIFVSSDLLKPSPFVGMMTDGDIEKYAIKRVQPDYPMLAQKHKIEGIVVMELKVGADGKVNDAQFVNGHAVFRTVSVEAAKQWEFKKGDSIAGIIRFTFKLK